MSSRLLYRGPTVSVLHEEYAKQGRIDDHAPVVAVDSLRIEASPHHVWQVLSAAADWHSVDPAISDVAAPDGVVTDGPFTWTNGNAKITSRFAVVDQDRELTWTGVSSGAKAVHRHVLHQLEDGATRLESEESMAGPFLTLFCQLDRHRLRVSGERDELLVRLDAGGPYGAVPAGDRVCPDFG